MFARGGDDAPFLLACRFCRQACLDGQADLGADGETHLDLLADIEGGARREGKGGKSLVAVALHAEQVEGLRKRPQERAGVRPPAYLCWKDIDRVLAPRDLPRAVEFEEQSSAARPRLQQANGAVVEGLRPRRRDGKAERKAEKKRRCEQL